jgi:hypothetical protein
MAPALRLHLRGLGGGGMTEIREVMRRAIDTKEATK